MTIKEYWKRLKEINNFLPYFPPDKLIEAPRATPNVLDDNELKDILDGILPQAFCTICKRNQCNVLVHPISNAMDYLLDKGSTCTITAHNSNNNSSSNSSTKGKGKGKVGKCPRRKNDISPKTATSWIADPFQETSASSTPARAMTATNAQSIRNHPMDWKSWRTWWKGPKARSKNQECETACS